MVCNFTLHTELNTNPPEFVISCFSFGGPASEVKWLKQINSSTTTNLQKIDHNISQLILNKSQHCEYENRLYIRGRETGSYTCFISNHVNVLIGNIKIAGEIILLHMNINSNKKSFSCRKAYWF